MDIAQLDGERHLIRVQVRRRMDEYLRDYLRPVTENSDVCILELETEIEGMLHGYAFKGYIDRIDERDGRIVIVDYKTGGDTKADGIRLDTLDPDERSTWPAAIASLQLPVYALLYAAQTQRSLGEIRPVYLRLGLGEMSPAAEHSFVSDESLLEDAYALASQVLEGLLSEIVNPAIPFLPAADLTTACVHCGFKTLCGTQWVRKRW